MPRPLGVSEHGRPSARVHTHRLWMPEHILMQWRSKVAAGASERRYVGRVQRTAAVAAICVIGIRLLRLKGKKEYLEQIQIIIFFR